MDYQYCKILGEFISTILVYYLSTAFTICKGIHSTLFNYNVFLRPIKCVFITVMNKFLKK